MFENGESEMSEELLSFQLKWSLSFVTLPVLFYKPILSVFSDFDRKFKKRE